MKNTRLLRWVLIPVIFLGAASDISAVFTIDPIAREHKDISRELAGNWNWPDGVLDLVNDSLRTIGWQEWFSGCSNDDKCFAFSTKKPADVQHLIDTFAKIKVDKLLIRLAAENGPLDPFSEDRSRLPGVEFSIGDQKMVDAWFKRLPEVEPGVRKFGFHRLKSPPSAGPPTLTLYMDNEHVSLDRLAIPRHVNLDTEYGLGKGRRPAWKWDEARKEWGPPPKKIVDFIERHRQQQTNPDGEKANR